MLIIFNVLKFDNKVVYYEKCVLIIGVCIYLKIK